MTHKFVIAKRMEPRYKGSDGEQSRHRKVSYFVFTIAQASQMPLHPWSISQLIYHIIQKQGQQLLTVFINMLYILVTRYL